MVRHEGSFTADDIIRRVSIELFCAEARATTRLLGRGRIWDDIVEAIRRGVATRRIGGLRAWGGGAANLDRSRALTTYLVVYWVRGRVFAVSASRVPAPRAEFASPAMIHPIPPREVLCQLFPERVALYRLRRSNRLRAELARRGFDVPSEWLVGDYVVHESMVAVSVIDDPAQGPLGRIGLLMPSAEPRVLDRLYAPRIAVELLRELAAGKPIPEQVPAAKIPLDY